MSLYSRKILLIFLAIGLAGGAAAAAAQTGEEQKIAEEVRSRLIQLSEFGAFDWITFGVQGQKVTLMGYASRPSLHKSAEVAVSRLKGVTEVENKIEVLPLSPADDELRTLAYSAIYTNPVLQRYAPGGGVTHSGFMDEAATIMHWGLDASMSMKGPHAIHIIVKHGHVILAGQVGTELEKQAAEMAVQGISDVFSVRNMIQISG